MSFGSSSFPMPNSVLSKFLSAFGGLRQRVIWKLPTFSNDLQSQVPPNVYLLPWIPQNDLLGHPKSQIFITHCGNNGQHEALYHGIPMLGFFFWYDQLHNCQRMCKRVFGIKMDILNFTSTELSQNILQLLEDSRYRLNTEKVSRMLKKRPFAPSKEAAFWVDHILEFGTQHLQQSAINMTSRMSILLSVTRLAPYMLLPCLMFLLFKLLLCVFKALFNGTSALKCCFERCNTPVSVQ